MTADQRSCLSIVKASALDQVPLMSAQSAQARGELEEQLAALKDLGAVLDTLGGRLSFDVSSRASDVEQMMTASDKQKKKKSGIFSQIKHKAEKLGSKLTSSRRRFLRPLATGATADLGPGLQPSVFTRCQEVLDELLCETFTQLEKLDEVDQHVEALRGTYLD